MEEYTMELRYEKNIATYQCKVDLCDNIYISEIANMMAILKSFKYSNNLHRNLGKSHNKGGCLRGSKGLHPNPEMVRF
jgi:hypothetical protein